MSDYGVVIPTVGRPCLADLLHALSTDDGPAPAEVVVVNDRPGTRLAVDVPPHVRVLEGPGRGPAAARNVGWRAVRAPWIVFLDDDVRPQAGWRHALVRDLAEADAGDAAGSQGRLSTPLPADRAPTDWERQVAGLSTAAWITADMAYRRDVLAAVGGFDERFPRAYREDTDLAIRVRAGGHRLVRGSRSVTHPVRPAGAFVSLRRQAGNADDALLRRRYGRRWRHLGDVPAGRLRRHVAITAAAAAAVAAAVTGRARVATVAAALWLGGTAEFAFRRIAPGPRTPDEIARMLVTSVLIPPAAAAHRLRGWWRFRAVGR
jgi:glycosyltransferase involved in cell wall biosynthesis